MQDSQFKRSILTAALFGTVALTACAPESKNETPDTHTDPKVLVANDLAAFTKIPSSDLAAYDRQNYGLFSEVFGGTDNYNLIAFFDERIKHVLKEEDLKEFTSSPSNFSITSWSSDPDADKKMESAGAQVAASNIGMGLWFQAAVEGVTMRLYRKGEEIKIDSPRAGLMLIGPGYIDWVKLENGTKIDLPSEYRQSTLLHEARHSDCTGGITQKDLNVARTAKSMQEFDEKYTRNACGHLHTLCPKGHDLAGLAACDKHAWGAYTVGAIFKAAVTNTLSGRDRAILEASAIDSWDRVLVPKAKMLNGMMGKPDMSSKGIIEE